VNALYIEKPKTVSIWFNRAIGNKNGTTKIRNPPNELHLELQAMSEASTVDFFNQRRLRSISWGPLRRGEG
jgi:hypothetical protein